MSEQEALEIVGVPIGVYDGVGSWRSYRPITERKVYHIGLDTVAKSSLSSMIKKCVRATYYPIKERAGQFNIACGAIHSNQISWLFPTCKNHAALGTYGDCRPHVGLCSCPVEGDKQSSVLWSSRTYCWTDLSVAMFPEGFFFDLWITFLILSSPISGALVGIGVGFTRFLWNSSFPSPKAKQQPGTHIF